jgi:hypothetical protein
MPIAAEDVDRETGLARCHLCDSRFAYAGAPALGSAPPRRKPRVDAPRDVTLSEGDGEITIAWRWYTPKLFVTALVCVVWFGALVWVYEAARTSRSPYLLVLPLLHVAVGVLIAYGTLCGFVNTTTVRIDGNRMRVRHRPLPWPGNIDYPLTRVRQLYCQQSITRRRSGTYRNYHLVALMDDGRRRKVISADAADLPLFLEQQVEAWMKASDEPVPGEMVQA